MNGKRLCFKQLFVLQTVRCIVCRCCIFATVFAIVFKQLVLSAASACCAAAKPARLAAQRCLLPSGSGCSRCLSHKQTISLLVVCTAFQADNTLMQSWLFAVCRHVQAARASPSWLPAASQQAARYATLLYCQADNSSASVNTPLPGTPASHTAAQAAA